MMSCENKFEENIENLCELLDSNNIVKFKIGQIICMKGSSEGDNYMSIVKRVQIMQNECNENEKDSESLSLIIKRQIPSLSRRQLYRCDEAFYNEINAYKNIVPLLERYANTNNNNAVFPKCYFAGQDDFGELIVLEDLKELGYCMQNRLAGLELEYCLTVMKQLANLHAASIVAKQLNNKIFVEKCKYIEEIVYCKEAEEFYSNILDISIEESLNSLRKSNIDGCLSEPIRLIKNLQADLFRKIQTRIINSKENLSVMCHGDLWVNNIMFNTTSATTNVPLKVKFFDLQAMRYTSLVFDILHFIYTSTKRELRDAYTNALLETYCRELWQNLEKHFNQNQLNILRDRFSLKSISEEYYANVLYGLAISMWILPAVTFDPNDIPNLDLMSEMNTNPKEINCAQKLTSEYHTRMKDLALEFYQNDYFKYDLNN